MGGWQKAIGVGLTVAVATGAYTGCEVMAYNRIPEALIRPLDEMPPPLNGGADLKTLVCPADAYENCTAETALGRTMMGVQVELPITEIPEHVRAAAKAAEDRRFDKHTGIDGKRALGALAENLTTGYAKEGGSTITRQLAKLLWQRLTPSERRQCGIAIPTFEVIGLLDKLPEVDFDLTGTVDEMSEGCVALTLARDYSRDQVLEMYLNSLYFGRRAVGIQSAAQEYYGISARDLTLQKSAVLMSLVSEPSRLGVNPDDSTLPTEDLVRKYRNTLTGLQEMGEITTEEKDQLWDTPIRFIPYEPESQSDWSNADALSAHHFTDMVMAQASEILGKKPEDIEGYTIHTTLVSTHQQALHDIVAAEPLMQRNDLDIAAVSLNQDGAVTAMIGSKEPFSQQQNNFAIGQAGGGSGRPDGSVNKAFVWLTGYEAGMQPNQQIVVDEGEGVVLEKANGGRDWLINNAGGCDHLGRPDPCVMSPEEAVAVSSNIAAGLILKEVAEETDTNGTDVVGRNMQDLGVDIEPQEDGHFPAAIIFGARPVSPLGVSTGINNLVVRQGNALTPERPHIITEIIDRKGRVVYKYNPEPGEQVVDAEAAASTTRALNGVITSTAGTANGAIAEPSGALSVAGKTGTGSGSFENTAGQISVSTTDTWFAGSACIGQTTPEGQQEGVTISVWTGNPAGNVPISDISSYDNAQIGGLFFEKVLPPDDTCSLVEQPQESLEPAPNLQP